MAPARLAAFAVPVDLNRASAAELASLEGVGAKMAARIIAARPFATIDDLARVRGIGKKRLDVLRPRLSVTSDVTFATLGNVPLDD
jgi:competence ComEA-like helix-hairpin-helix protein